MKYDLKTPCKNCPFRSDATRIKFICRERAEEIEESAYRNGFPCHLSAEIEEFEQDGNIESGYVEGKNTQHCVGFVIMHFLEGEDTWPGLVDDDGEINSESVANYLRARVDMDAPVFGSSEEFIDANS